MCFNTTTYVYPLLLTIFGGDLSQNIFATDDFSFNFERSRGETCNLASGNQPRQLVVIAVFWKFNFECVHCMDLSVDSITLLQLSFPPANRKCYAAGAKSSSKGLDQQQRAIPTEL